MRLVTFEYGRLQKHATQSLLWGLQSPPRVFDDLFSGFQVDDLVVKLVMVTILETILLFPECVARVPVSNLGVWGLSCVRQTSATVGNRSQP